MHFGKHYFRRFRFQNSRFGFQSNSKFFSLILQNQKLFIILDFKTVIPLLVHRKGVSNKLKNISFKSEKRQFI